MRGGNAVAAEAVKVSAEVIAWRTVASSAGVTDGSRGKKNPSTIFFCFNEKSLKNFPKQSFSKGQLSSKSSFGIPIQFIQIMNK